MRNTQFTVIAILLTIIAISFTGIAVNNTYGMVELRRFNKLNKTNYTMEQWAIYEYDIKKLYPFTGQN